MMLDLEVHPERSLGNGQYEFVLGMPLGQAINVLKKQHRAIKSVQMWYSEQNPMFTDLVLNLAQDGIKLIFDAQLQTLKVIEVYNISKLNLRYCGSHFCSQTISPTVSQIEACFGATRPGVYHADRQIYLLTFRGLQFEFQIESSFEPHYLRDLGALQFPSGVAPVLSRMFIFFGAGLDEARTPPIPICCYHGDPYVDAVEVLRERNVTKGLRIVMNVEGTERGVTESLLVRKEAVIRFGDTPQDVTTLLGSPAKVFYKFEDKMKIHSREMQRSQGMTGSDYFFNYPSLGLDILFDATVHRACKFVLHTNFPGHFNFGMYTRCPFKLPLSLSGQDTLVVDAATKWNTVHEMLPRCDRPVVLNRSSSTNTTNPFGSTFCFGFQDIILEVMPNNHIGLVTLYGKQGR